MIELPWPPRELHPNSRVDRRYSTLKRQKYRMDCYYLALNTKHGQPYGNNIHLKLTFHPPDKRPRDLDGMFGAIKFGLDGIASAWGIDDVSFRPVTLDVGSPVKNGKIVLTIGE